MEFGGGLCLCLQDTAGRVMSDAIRPGLFVASLDAANGGTSWTRTTRSLNVLLTVSRRC